jgi:hypothetical protein
MVVPGLVAPLSGRQLEVLPLLAAGEPNRARELGLLPEANTATSWYHVGRPSRAASRLRDSPAGAPFG